MTPSDLDGMVGFFITTLLGLVLGSFSSAISSRIPDGKSWIVQRSACPLCHHKLGIMDLFPIISWVLLAGKCRYCKAEISPRYPLIEMITTLACLGIYLAMGMGLAAIVAMIAVPFLVAHIVIDMDHMILPDQINIILAVLGAVFVILSDEGLNNLMTHIGGAVVYAGMIWILGVLMQHVLKREAVGMGDVKFFAVAGLWLGLTMFPVFLILSGVMGAVFGIFWKFTRGGVLFPFGPALVLALYAGVLLSGEWPGFLRF